MPSFNPKNPSKYTGTDKYITFFVSRSRSPTGADYRQPETGFLYSLGTVWQVAKDPSTGTEGDLWMLCKIVANVAYWVKISSGVVPSGGILTLSDTVNTLVYPTVAGNIQLQGTAGQINIVSDPVNNKLVFSLGGGGQSIDSIAVQAVSAPGVSPVLPDINGLITVNGAIVANHSVPIESRSRALNAYNIEVQYSAAVASTDGTKSGLSHYNSSQFTVDASGFVSLNGSSVAMTITGQSGGPLSPTAGNWNIFGLGEMTTSGSVSTLSILQPRAAKFIVDPVQYYGTHQTLTAALAAASSGDTILMRPGTYTENGSLKAGVDIVALGYSGFSPGVTLNGKWTASFSGRCTISGVRMQTNSDFALEVSGANATIVNLYNVFVSVTNNTAISYTCSNASSELNTFYCQGNVTNTGITYFVKTSPGALSINYTQFGGNTGLSTTSSTNSDGSANFRFSSFVLPLAFSSTSVSNFQNCILDTGVINSVCITTSGTATGSINASRLFSGSASCLSLGAGTAFSAASNRVNSTNTNVFTGAGSIDTGGNVCINSSGNNVSTINNLTVI